MNGNESKYFNTARLMDEALLRLLEKKDFDFITVKEICKTAGVNRSTFYLHYETIDDLLKETVEMVSRGFASRFEEVKEQADPNKVLTTESFLRPYLAYIRDNKKIYGLMHEKPDLFAIEEKWNRIYKDYFVKALDHFRVPDTEKPYVLSFYIEGVLGIVRAWVRGGCEDDIDLVISIIERNTFADEKNR